MKTIIIMAALSLMACDAPRPKAVAGWAERDVIKWATALGYPNALYTCVTDPNFMVDDAASYASCSVMIEGRATLVFCDGQTNQCRLGK
jgi:hypothetical protein